MKRVFAWPFIIFGMPLCGGGCAVVDDSALPIDSPLQNYIRNREFREAAREQLRLKMTHRLAPGDIVEEDVNGQVTAIRHATTPPTWTHFKAGAVSPPNEDIVWGEPR